MRTGYLCAVLTVLLAGCGLELPEERHIPEPPARPDGGTPAFTRTPPRPYEEVTSAVHLDAMKALHATTFKPQIETRQQGLGGYCASWQVRNCWTGCAPGDPWAGWWCDHPQYAEVQLFDGTACKIINGTYTEPGQGFPAGGLHDHAAWFYPASPLMVRTGPGAYGAHWPQKCWLGDYTIFWPGMEYMLQTPPRSTAVWPG